jgi:hypothetical protein
MKDSVAQTSVSELLGNRLETAFRIIKVPMLTTLLKRSLGKLADVRKKGLPNLERYRLDCIRSCCPKALIYPPRPLGIDHGKCTRARFFHGQSMAAWPIKHLKGECNASLESKMQCSAYKFPDVKTLLNSKAPDPAVRDWRHELNAD